ncbi:uncharacterized protein LOC130735627 [Lotus japonicus]|uniref:uncharacterized protein LOC130735627 n=1 Tax=Lotus japonicus TaxID=34305 RepID=UPI00258709ED|nr:uncharacterized protein LOC130735627 [Lotus japonicus]
MGQGEVSNSWSDIPQDLLEEIVRKLTLVDYLNCRRVCQSWRRIVKDAVATKGTCPPARQFPFLMLLPPNFQNKNPVTTLLDITQENNTSYTIPIPQTWRGCFDFDRVFSVQGWVVFQKIYYKENWNYDLLLFCNPVSGERFELPHLPLFQGQDFTHKIYVKPVFSTAPPNSSDFVVVLCAILYLPQEDRWRHQLAFYKVTDKKWALIPTDQSQRFSEFVILDRKLYAMSMLLYKSGCVTVFNLTDSNNITFEKLEPERIQPVLSRTCMLARDGDEILLVVPDSRIIREITGFCVFKLDMMCGGSRWIEVDDLGDLVLLMDSAGIQVISAKDINLPRKLSEGNCIIFYSVERDLKVFSLKDKRIRKFPLSQVSGDRSLWLMPSLW